MLCDVRWKRKEQSRTRAQKRVEWAQRRVAPPPERRTISSERGPRESVGILLQELKNQVPGGCCLPSLVAEKASGLGGGLLPSGRSMRRPCCRPPDAGEEDCAAMSCRRLGPEAQSACTTSWDLQSVSVTSQLFAADQFLRALFGSIMRSGVGSAPSMDDPDQSVDGGPPAGTSAAAYQSQQHQQHQHHASCDSNEDCLSR